MASPILRSAIFRHSAAVNIFPFSRSRIIAGVPFPIARAPRWDHREITIGLERQHREKEPIDFPAIHSRKPPRSEKATEHSRSAASAPGVQKSIAYECTSPRPSTELHQRAAGGIKKCCSIKETKQMLRRGHSNLAQATSGGSSR